MAANPTVRKDQQGEPSCSIADIMAELKQMKTELVGKIDPLIEKQAIAQQFASALAEKLKEAEERITALEQQLQPLITENKKAAIKIRELEAKTEDQESRSRRSNVRIVGLAEGAEPAKMAPFIEDLIKEVLPEAELSPVFIIECAHRALQKKPPPGAPPRAILLKCLNYRDRDAILNAAREKGEIRYKGTILQFFPDFTLAIQRARKDFQDTKKILREKKVKYAMLFPARLRITQNGRSFFFTCPGEAKKYAMELQASRSPGGLPLRRELLLEEAPMNAND